ncbi:MAG TPA: hypothetical protein VK453_23965 [Micromonosporaceae bacterium]|nr:hypothetical protein [Micromonosporaceae bacterium]
MVGVRARGLSAVDLEQIRGTVAAGRRPKVVFTEAAGQIAGQVGQVVALTDPDLSDEWLVVRFGRDELPFSPADLTIAPRASRRTSAVEVPTVPARREETPVPAAASSKAAGKAGAPAPPARAAAPVNGRTAAAQPSAPAAPPTVAPAAAPSPPAATTPPPPGAATSGAGRTDQARADHGPGDAAQGERKPSARKPAKAKPPAALTVTLAYAAGEWTVGATQGSKSLAKPYVIKASEALKMVSMLDVPGVQEAVEDIVVAARSQAEQQAERLRAELAELEARLAELRDVG